MVDRLIYTAMSGANAASQRQAVVANNLANTATNGFRAELSTYRAVPVRGEGASTRVLAMDATSGHLDLPGSAERTGRDLDIMAGGNAWLAVQGLDGTEAYTRRGALEVASDGTLRTLAGGFALLSDAGAPIAVPANADISIGFDGTITAKVGKQAPTTLGRIKLATPTLEDPLRRSADGLFRTASGEPVASDPTARVQSGVLESSNVNAVVAMVEMIQAARQFENQMRMIQNRISGTMAQRYLGCA